MRTIGFSGNSPLPHWQVGIQISSPWNPFEDPGVPHLGHFGQSIFDLCLDQTFLEIPSLALPVVIISSTTTRTCSFSPFAPPSPFQMTTINMPYHWSPRQDSNPHLVAYKASALPIKLQGLIGINFRHGVRQPESLYDGRESCNQEPHQIHPSFHAASLIHFVVLPL